MTGKMDDELFGIGFMAEVRKITRVSEEERLQGFRDALMPVGIHYRAVIATTPSDLPRAPFNMSLTKRADWLTANVVKPVERLLDALAEVNQPHFATWPDDSPPPPRPDPDGLAHDLDMLRAFGHFLVQQLRYQQESDAGHSQEIRAMVFCAIAPIVRQHFGVEAPASRGTYDAAEGCRVGRYPELMRLVFREITGAADLLDRLIRQEVDHPS